MPGVLLLLALVLSGLIAGCGDASSAGETPVQPKPSAQKEDFPAAAGKTLADLRGTLPEGPILSPAVSVLEPGRNRVAFALFDRARKQLSGAQVAVYIGRPDGSRSKGPFLARSESLAVKPQFRSRQTASDPDAARQIYVADVKLPKGRSVMTALVRLDGRLVTTQQMTVEAGGANGLAVPKVGERAPRISTPTAADVGGNLEKIDTRVPPLAQFHEVDFADVVGRRPVVLIFATPQLCQSRVCGPVVDVAAQVKARVGDALDVVHMEIYKDNELNQGFRPQVAKFGLPTEPWTFLVGSDGRIAERFEGAFSVGELRRAVAKIVQGR